MRASEPLGFPGTARYLRREERIPPMQNGGHYQPSAFARQRRQAIKHADQITLYLTPIHTDVTL